MSKFKISYISDCVFVFFFSFMIFFAPVSFFIKKKILAAIVAFFAAVIPLTIFIFVSRKKFGRLAVKKTEEEEYERTKTAFLLSNNDFVDKTLLALLKKIKNQARKQNDYFILPNNERAFYKFSSRPVGADDLIKAYKSAPAKCSVIFFAISYDDFAFSFAKNLGMRMKLVDFPKLYFLLKENECLPPLGESEKNVPPKKRIRILAVFVAAFDKKKARTFAFYGILTLILGRFSFYPVYYTVTGCLFLIYAVVTKFFAPRPEPEKI